MPISESFLVNPDRLNPIIETLIENGEVPEKITEEELRTIGFSNPADLLVIHILKELQILTPEGAPTELFDKLIDPDTSAKAIAEGIIHGYKDLMDKHEDMHKMKTEEVKDIIDNYFEGQKTDLVLKYMANTFIKLVTFAGQNNVEKAYKNAVDKQKEEEQTSEADPVLDNFHDAREKKEKLSMNGNGTDSVETVTEVKQEQRGESSIEEVLGVDDSAKESQESTELESETSEIKEETDTEADAKQKIAEKNELDFNEPSEPEQPEPEENPDDMEKKLEFLNSSEKVKEAFIKKSDLLYKLERFEELAPTLNTIIEKFDDSDDEQLKTAVAKSVIRRAKVLAELKRNDELLPALDEIIDRFEDSDNDQYYEHASTAMLNKANLLESKNKTSGLLPLYDKITERLDSSSNRKIIDQVDQVYLKKMELVLEQTDDNDKKLDAVNGVINRFKDTTDADKYLEEAMFVRAKLIEEMGNDEEALEAYSEFLDRFGS